MINEEEKSERQVVKDDISNRELFDYSFFSYMCRIRCCCRLCFKQRREERIYLKAEDKLNAEIDLLNITKQLRINKFVSQTKLKPH
jgi:hypothetical protein